MDGTVSICSALYNVNVFYNARHSIIEQDDKRATPESTYAVEEQKALEIMRKSIWWEMPYVHGYCYFAAVGELLGISAKAVRQRIAAKLEEQGFINFHRSIEISARMKSQRPGGSERDKDEQYLIHRARMHQGIDCEQTTNNLWHWNHCSDSAALAALLHGDGCKLFHLMPANPILQATTENGRGEGKGGDDSAVEFWEGEYEASALLYYVEPEPRDGRGPRVRERSVPLKQLPKMVNEGDLLIRHDGTNHWLPIRKDTQVPTHLTPEGDGGRAMEVERTQNSTTAKAPEPDQEIAPNQTSHEARKRRFQALLPSTESPSRHRQLSRPPGYLSRPRASDFFYAMPSSTAAGDSRNGTTTMTSQTSPQTGNVPPRSDWERTALGPQGEGGRTMEVERTQGPAEAAAPEPEQGLTAARSSRQGNQGRKRNRNRSGGRKEAAAKRTKTG